MLYDAEAAYNVHPYDDPEAYQWPEGQIQPVDPTAALNLWDGYYGQGGGDAPLPPKPWNRIYDDKNRGWYPNIDAPADGSQLIGGPDGSLTDAYDLRVGHGGGPTPDPIQERLDQIWARQNPQAEPFAPEQDRVDAFWANQGGGSEETGPYHVQSQQVSGGGNAQFDALPPGYNQYRSRGDQILAATQGMSPDQQLAWLRRANSGGGQQRGGQQQQGGMPQVQPPDFMEVMSYDSPQRAHYKEAYNRSEEARYHAQLQFLQPTIQAQAHAWLSQQELSQKETMQMQRQQAAVGDIMADSTLTDEEKASLVMQIKHKIDPLMQRAKLGQQKALMEQHQQMAQHAQLQNEMLMQQNAVQMSMQNMDAAQLKQHAADHTAVLPNGDLLYTGTPGKPMHIKSDHKEDVLTSDKYRADWMYKFMRDEERTTKNPETGKETTIKVTPEEARQAFNAFHAQVRPDSADQMGMAPTMPETQHKGTFEKDQKLAMAKQKADMQKIAAETKANEYPDEKIRRHAALIVKQQRPDLQAGTPEHTQALTGEVSAQRQIWYQNKYGDKFNGQVSPGDRMAEIRAQYPDGKAPPEVIEEFRRLKGSNG